MARRSCSRVGSLSGRGSGIRGFGAFIAAGALAGDGRPQVDARGAAADDTSVFLTSQRARGAGVAIGTPVQPAGGTTIAPQTSKVLILAREPLAAALLGILLEVDAYEPAFARPDESPEEAVQRVRPVLVILLDGSLDAARSDVFHARAKGTPVILFGTPPSAAVARAVALERRLPWFTMPVDRASLTRVIQETVESSAVRSGGDRRRPTARRRPDGTLVYHDREGRKWHVYDRRKGERRGHSSSDGYRAFVNEAGEEWRFDLTGDEADQRSAPALERQLAAAVRYARTSTSDSQSRPSPPDAW